jgi:hypothetical protein
MKPNLEYKFDSEKASRSAGSSATCERCTRKTSIQQRRDLSNKIAKEWGRCGHCNTSWTRYREIFVDDAHKQVVSMTDHD